MYFVLYCILYTSVPRFTTREQREALAEWLDWVAAKEDVWFVTGTQTLLWMTDPTPLNRLNSFEPWQCEDKPVYLLSNVSNRAANGTFAVQEVLLLVESV